MTSFQSGILDQGELGGGNVKSIDIGGETAVRLLLAIGTGEDISNLSSEFCSYRVVRFTG